MPIEVGLSQAARNDLLDIWTCSSDRWGSVRADAYVDELLDRIGGLTDTPRMGSDCSHLVTGARRLRCGRHVEFYMIGDTHIEAARLRAPPDEDD